MDEEEKAEVLAMIKYLHAKDYEGPSSDSDSDILSPTPASFLSKQGAESETGREDDESEKEGDEEVHDEEQPESDRLQQSLLSSLSFLTPLSFKEARFTADDRSTLYHTGLPDMISICALIDKVYPSQLGQSFPKEKLTLKEQFVMILTRFRKGESTENLSYCYEVPKPQVNKIFLRHLAALAEYPHLSVRWPETDKFTRNIPQPFTSVFGSKPLILLKIVEVELLDVPVNYQLRLELYAPKKRWHSVKFVIATIVDGEIVFVSQALGGRVPNNHVIEHSGIADKLAEDSSLVPVAPRNLLAEKIKFQDFAVTPFNVLRKEGSENYLHPWSLESCKKINALQDSVTRAVDKCHSNMRLFDSALFGEDLMQKCRHDDLTTFDKLIKVWAALCNMCQNEIE